MSQEWKLDPSDKEALEKAKDGDLGPVLELLLKSMAAVTAGFATVNSKLDTVLQGELVPPDATQKAKRFTACISTSTSTSTSSSRADYQVGHGLVVALDMGDDETGYYLLTAAHVLVTWLRIGTGVMMHWGEQDSETKGPKIEANVESIYVDKRYVLYGEHDIGLAKLDITTSPQDLQAKMDGRVLVTESLACAGATPLVGTTVVASGPVVHLRGRVIRGGSSCRMLVDAFTPPDCSGCPMFSPSGQLAALVHGGVKHDGQCRRGSMNEHPTTLCYVDKADFASYDFQKVKDEEARVTLEYAANISEEEAAKPDTTSYSAAESSDGLAMLVQRLGGLPIGSAGEEETSVLQIMERLASDTLADTGKRKKVPNILQCLAVPAPLPELLAATGPESITVTPSK